MKRKQEKPEKEPRPEHVQPEQVLTHLSTLSKPAGIRQIAHAMGLKRSSKARGVVIDYPAKSQRSHQPSANALPKRRAI
jgi:hypothetical protein